jgi:hypothetical protein
MDRQKMQEQLAFSAKLQSSGLQGKNSTQWRKAAGLSQDEAFAKAEHANKAKSWAHECRAASQLAERQAASAAQAATASWAATQLAENEAASATHAAASAAHAAELLMIASDAAEKREHEARLLAEKLRAVEAAAELGRKMEEDKQIQAALLEEARLKKINKECLVPGLVNLCCCYVDYVLNKYVFYQECLKVSPLYVAVKATPVTIETMEEGDDFDALSETSSDSFDSYWPWPHHVLVAFATLSICDVPAVPPPAAGVPAMLGPVL